MTTSEYFAIGKDIPRGDANYVMSRTELLTFAKCPDAWYRGRKFEGNDSTRWGSLVDTMLLIPDEFEDLYAVQPAKYPDKDDPSKLKNWWPTATYCKNWKVEQVNAGREIISNTKRKEAAKAVKLIHDDTDAGPIIENSKKQEVCQWNYVDERTGITVPLKCMLDLVGPDDYKFLGDLKTARDGSLEGFKRHGRFLRYDIQVAFYKWGYRECYEDRDTWVFVVSENESPYPVSTYWVDMGEENGVIPRVIESGRDGITDRYGKHTPGYTEMLEHYCHCLKTNQWPSYTTEPTELHFY